jgi:hypothetical protein
MRTLAHLARRHVEVLRREEDAGDGGGALAEASHDHRGVDADELGAIEEALPRARRRAGRAAPRAFARVAPPPRCIRRRRGARRAGQRVGVRFREARRRSLRGVGGIGGVELPLRCAAPQQCRSRGLCAHRLRQRYVRRARREAHAGGARDERSVQAEALREDAADGGTDGEAEERAHHERRVRLRSIARRRDVGEVQPRARDDERAPDPGERVAHDQVLERRREAHAAHRDGADGGTRDEERPPADALRDLRGGDAKHEARPRGGGGDDADLRGGQAERARQHWKDRQHDSLPRKVEDERAGDWQHALINGKRRSVHRGFERAPRHSVGTGRHLLDDSGRVCVARRRAARRQQALRVARTERLVAKKITQRVLLEVLQPERLQRCG